MSHATTLSDILSYSTFTDGWDGDGSLAPSSFSIQRLQLALRSLPPRFPASTAMLSSDGAVGIYWHICETYVELDFDISGCASFFSRKNGTETFQDCLTDEMIIGTWLSNHLSSLLN